MPYSYQTWNNPQRKWYAPRGSSQMMSLATKLYKDANTEIANLVIAKMEPEEILERLGDVTKLKSISKAQILLKFPKMHKVIDVAELEADHRTIILCCRPTKGNLKKFDMNADDMKARQYQYILELGNKNLVSHMYKTLTDEKIALFQVDDWESLLSYIPQAGRRLDIKTIRNQSYLRHLILRRPHILRHATLEDMKNSVIDGPTWIRIIAKMSPKERAHVPAGFIGWTQRDVFKKQLGGRRFKNFGKDWMEGLAQ